MFTDLFVYLFYAYLALDAVFGVYFVGWGAARIGRALHCGRHSAAALGA